MTTVDASPGQGILIGLGANLPSKTHGTPGETLMAALRVLAGEGVEVVACSRFYESAPVPPSDQPWYINAVAEVRTDLGPGPLLALLLDIEARFGRKRAERNAARILDLDLLAYGNVVSGPGAAPELPHPRLHERAFVLMPLAEIAPRWRHPRSGRSVGELVAALAAGQFARPCPDQPPGRGAAGRVLPCV